MKSESRWVAWLGLALLVAFSGYAATLSSSYGQCQTDHGATYASKNQPDFFEKADTIVVCEGVSLDANGILVTAIATAFMALFTGQLLIANIRQEQMSRTHERAYVIFGGLFGKPIDADQIANFKRCGDDSWRDASLYTEPWIMQIHNFGRTPGFITMVRWGECTESAFIRDKSVSEIIERKLLPLEPPVLKESVVNLTTVDNPFPYRHVQHSRFAGQVFFGRIDYRDVFKKPHHSTWVVVHREHSSDAIGNMMADDWS